jgi:hypothetical protein
MRYPNFASTFSRKRFQQNSDRSQGVVEFALALPILLMLLFGIIDFSLLFSAWLLIQNMSRQAVRYAVTGEYNPAYCTAGCATTADEDQARLKSIHDQANKYLSGLLVDSSAILQNEPGFLQITVCSSPDYQTIIGLMGSATQYSKCKRLSDNAYVENPGGPGDAVIVMIDFDHPYLTPFINKIWPQVHLVSAQQGIIEKFRVSRALSSPPAIYMGTPTPSMTFTITNTPTETDTPTPTSTASITPTPTLTQTPSPTATPDCSLFTFTSNVFTLTTYGATQPRANITILNSSDQDTYIQNLVFDWGVYDATLPSQDINKIRYGGSLLYGVDQPSSPATWVLVGPPAANHQLSANTTEQFNFDFLDVDAAWPGDAYPNTFGLSVHLGNECDVVLPAQSAPTATNTSTPTKTGTPTRTFTPSNTASITNTPSKTNTPSNTPTATNTNTPSKTPTRTNTVPTSTQTNTPTRTRTSTASNTVPTNTPSRTPTKTNTVPTSTNTRTNTATNTVPTSTNTRTNTATNTVPTNTSSRTPTRTNTVPTSTFTNTVPTATNTPSKTSTLTPSRTPTQTSSPTTTPITPTATRTPTVPTATKTATFCPSCYGYVEPPILASNLMSVTYLRYHQFTDAYLRAARYESSYKVAQSN